MIERTVERDSFITSLRTGSEFYLILHTWELYQERVCNGSAPNISRPQTDQVACTAFCTFLSDIHSESFIQLPSRLAGASHSFVSSCGSPSTTNPSGPIASTSRHLSASHRIASPNLTNPLLPLAVPRTHNYFVCPTRVRCGILPHIGGRFFKGFKCIFPYLIALSIYL